ncbi:MAG: hypothetical protein ACLRSD_01895 [Oscillibacter sp.]
MTEKMLARVAVSSVPYAADRLYTYLVPDELIGSAEAGKRVTIPFGRGNRRVEGFLLEVGREAATSPLKPIDALPRRCAAAGCSDIRLVRCDESALFLHVLRRDRSHRFCPAACGSNTASCGT